MTDTIKRRGRPPKVETPDEVVVETVSAPKKRRRRASVGGHALKLSAPARPGYTRRFVNGDPARLAEMEELGYDFVNDRDIKTDDPSTRIARTVGTLANGDAHRQYLMETPDELYAEGVAEKEAHAAQIDDAIRAGRDHTGQMDENSYGQGSIKVSR